MEADIWFVCKYCRRAFKQRADLCKHKRELHSEELNLRRLRLEREAIIAVSIETNSSSDELDVKEDEKFSKKTEFKEKIILSSKLRVHNNARELASSLNLGKTQVNNETEQKYVTENECPKSSKKKPEAHVLPAPRKKSKYSVSVAAESEEDSDTEFVQGSDCSSDSMSSQNFNTESPSNSKNISSPSCSEVDVTGASDESLGSDFSICSNKKLASKSKVISSSSSSDVKCSDSEEEDDRSGIKSSHQSDLPPTKSNKTPSPRSADIEIMELSDDSLEINFSGKMSSRPKKRTYSDMEFSPSSPDVDSSSSSLVGESSPEISEADCLASSSSHSSSSVDFIVDSSSSGGESFKSDSSVAPEASCSTSSSVSNSPSHDSRAQRETRGTKRKRRSLRHTAEAAADFPCSYCAKNFKSLKHLKKHKLTHLRYRNECFRKLKRKTRRVRRDSSSGQEGEEKVPEVLLKKSKKQEQKEDTNVNGSTGSSNRRNIEECLRKNQQQHPCNKCEKVYQSAKELRLHIKWHKSTSRAMYQSFTSR